MASEDSLQKRVDEVEECLGFVDKTLQSVKEVVEEEYVINENKEKGDKICVEANERTVEALKRNLEAIQKTIKGDDKAIFGVENSLKALEETIKSGRKIATNEKVDEEGGLTIEEKLANVMRSFEKTAETINDLHKLVIEDEKSVEKGNETSANGSVGNREMFKDQPTENVSSDMEEETIENEGEFAEALNNILCGNVAADDDSDEENHAKRKHNIFKAYKHIGMDNYLNAMLFSEQLMEYVLKKLGYHWLCHQGARNFPTECVSVRFSKVIGEAVFSLIDRNIEKIADSYKQLMDRNIHTIRLFRMEVCITATFYFSEGYSHRNFLIYASQLTGLSAFYFASGEHQIAEASAQVLAYILNHYTFHMVFSPTFDWFNLYLEAQKIRREIQDGKIEFVTPSEISETTVSCTEDNI